MELHQASCRTSKLTCLHVSAAKQTCTVEEVTHQPGIVVPDKALVMYTVSGDLPRWLGYLQPALKVASLLKAPQSGCAGKSSDMTGMMSQDVAYQGGTHHSW